MQVFSDLDFTLLADFHYPYVVFVYLMKSFSFSKIASHLTPVPSFFFVSLSCQGMISLLLRFSRSLIFKSRVPYDFSSLPFSNSLLDLRFPPPSFD